MGDNPQTKGSRAGIIASAAIGMVIFIVGAFFAGLAIGYGLGADSVERSASSQPHRKPPVERPAPDRGGDRDEKPNAFGRWYGDLSGAKPGTVELNLQTANSLQGSDGCNSGGGNWKLEGSTVYFAELRSTMKACLDFGDPYLFRAATGEISEDGSTMELFDGEGESIGTLYRAGKAVGTPAPKEG